MVDPAATSAATPAANDPNGGNLTPAPANNPGNNNQPQAQNQPAPFIMSQEQFNARWAEEKGKLEKELGLEPGGLKDFVEKSKKPAPAPAASTEKLTGADRRIAVMETLMLAKVPSEKIPGLISRVQGANRAEIEADIQKMIKDGFIVIEKPAPAAQPQQQPQQQQNPAQQPPPNAAQGAGIPGVPPGPKVWTRAEIGKLTPDEYEKNRNDIMKAMSEGRIRG